MVAGVTVASFLVLYSFPLLAVLQAMESWEDEARVMVFRFTVTLWGLHVRVGY